jgi:hypothetical protein
MKAEEKDIYQIYHVRLQMEKLISFKTDTKLPWETNHNIFIYQYLNEKIRKNCMQLFVSATHVF